MHWSVFWLSAAMVLPGAAAMAAGWKVYTFPEQSFSIESPVPLSKGSGTYKALIAGTLPTVTYTAENDGVAYKVSVIDISKRIADSVNLFEEMEVVTELRGKVISNASAGIEPGALRRYGRELTIDSKDGTRQRITLMYAKGKLYMAEANILPGGDRDSIYPERFAGSIVFDLEAKFRERDADPANFIGPDGKQ